MNNNNNKNESKQYPTKLEDMNFKTEFYHQGWESGRVHFSMSMMF